MWPLKNIIATSWAQRTRNRFAPPVETLLIEFAIIAGLLSKQDIPISANCLCAAFEAEAVVIIDIFTKITLFVLAFLEKPIAAASTCAERCTEFCILIIGTKVTLFTALDDTIAA